MEYLTGVQISVRELRDLHMNDLTLWSFEQPWRSYSLLLLSIVIYLLLNMNEK